LLLGHKDVITIGVNGRAIDAFKIMTDRGVSAVGVVDEEGKLVGNISVRDIRVPALFSLRMASRLRLAADD
jgi:CBS domain-containing protein